MSVILCLRSPASSISSVMTLEPFLERVARVSGVLQSEKEERSVKKTSKRRAGEAAHR